MLSNVGLRRAIAGGQLVIDPLDESAIQPASIDLTLGPHFAWLKPRTENMLLDTRVNNEDLFERYEAQPGELVYLWPGDCLLGATQEWIGLDEHLVARFEGKSGIGRLFISTHITAGFVDPGFAGVITLEIKNENPVAVVLWPGMPIGQLAVDLAMPPATILYGTQTGSHQQIVGDRRPVLSQTHKNWEKRHAAFPPAQYPAAATLERAAPGDPAEVAEHTAS